jgi:hypothetical protein
MRIGAPERGRRSSDVRANPDGYYVVSLRTQLSHGDLRIVNATGEVFHLCTSSAATPDMETTRALLLMSLLGR